MQDYPVRSLSTLISRHLHDDVQQLALQRNRFPQLSDADFRFFLQQIEGRQRTAHKLPSFAQIPDWWYPARLSCEQCSSEATAQYKALITDEIGAGQWDMLIDLTGGYGVDTYFLSAHAHEAHYVERNAELCAIAQHNFALVRPHIQVHCTTAEDFLSTLPDSLIASSPHTLIYLDPARRSQSGSKVYRIEDCEPNIINLLHTLRKHAATILIKFSPMLDITAAIQSLGMEWDVHIVAVHNEVKEVLLLTGSGTIHATNILPTHTSTFSFQQHEEKNALSTLASTIKTYLYEPNAAIIKSGAFRLVGERYALEKLDTHTHLYTSDTYLPHFPGRVWQVNEPAIKDAKRQLDSTAKYSIVSRNYPLSPEQLRKKYKLLDGNDFYLIGARIAGKPTLILCQGRKGNSYN